MPFIDEILSHRSVSIVGLEKNTGKTETLNYILNRLKTSNVDVALTSIGVDGEQTDSVTRTPKPEITLGAGMVFVTSEKHYLQRRLVSEILDVGEEYTALGRLVTARARSEGKCVISGPTNTQGIKKLIGSMARYGVQTTLVDGALSRLSPASPAVTDAMILATGAAVSANIPQLVRQTRFVQRLIALETVEPALAARLQTLTGGIWAVDDDGGIHDLEIPSVFLLDKREKDIFRFGTRLYVAGAVSGKLLDFLRQQRRTVQLVMHDFTKMFALQASFDAFVRSGNTVQSAFRSKLIAVTVNPVSPNGFRFDSDTLQAEMRQALGVPVYDVRKLLAE